MWSAPLSCVIDESVNCWVCEADCDWRNTEPSVLMAQITHNSEAYSWVVPKDSMLTSHRPAFILLITRATVGVHTPQKFRLGMTDTPIILFHVVTLAYKLHKWCIQVMLLLSTARRAATSCMCYGKSFCLSVCPSHSGIVSKLGNVEGCGLHHRVAQFL